MTRRPDRVPVRLYRWVLAAYPPAFRLTFADSMTADFTDAWHDARRSGRTRDLVNFLGAVAADLAWSVTRQWLRTSVPWLTASYATAIACFCECLAAAMQHSTFDPGVVAALLPLVSAITYAGWFLVPQIRRQRDRPICLTSAT